jgi:hypothetical protein
VAAREASDQVLESVEHRMEVGFVQRGPLVVVDRGVDLPVVDFRACESGAELLVSSFEVFEVLVLLPALRGGLGFPE